LAGGFLEKNAALQKEYFCRIGTGACGTLVYFPLFKGEVSV
jgi:hypothetical protein